jgi:hypothetical protein
MNTEQIRALLRIKRVLDQLRDIDQSTLTPTEHEAWKDMMAQAYDRAAYLLQNTYTVQYPERRADGLISIREQIATY